MVNWAHKQQHVNCRCKFYGRPGFSPALYTHQKAKMRMNKANLLSIALLLAGIVGAGLTSVAKANDSKALADHLIAMTAHPGGVVVLPRCGDGQLAVALAQRSESPIVYAADSRPEQYAAARETAAQVGLLGRSVYVQQAEVSSLPLADSYADLVVFIDLTDADLQPALLSEVQRVLVPQTGCAVVGRAKSAAGSGTLTRTALEAWARAGGKATDVKIVEDAQGLWAVFGRPAIEGTDDWTHWFHGPDNNPLSADKAFYGVPQIAWMAKPYRLPRMACRVEARGRIYYVTGGNSHWAEWDEGLIWNLFAYNAYNGRLLWNQPWPAGQRTDGSVLIADGDTLLTVDGASVRRIDGATGKELGRFAPADANAGHIKWMALIDGLLTVHIGPPEPVDKKAKSLISTKENPKKLGYGSILVACDPATGKQVWRYDAPKPMDCQQIAASAGHLYYCVPGAGVTCLDTKTGKQVWVNATPEVTDQLEKENGLIRWKFRPGLVCTPDAVYVGILDSPALLALSAKDGKVLWSKSQTKRSAAEEAKYIADGHEGTQLLTLVRGNQLIVRGGMGNSHFFNALTGQETNDDKVTTFGAGCGAITGTAKYLIGQVGGPVYDFDKHENLRIVNSKTACALGQFVSQGQLYAASYDCFCDWTPGFSSLAPVANLDYKRPPNVAEQLVTGAGDIEKVAPLPTDARDWTTHRGNAAHSGNIAAELPTTAPKILWTYSNPVPFSIPKRVPFSEETEHKLTEAVTADGLLFFGASDGRVQCLSAADGSPKWTYWTEGGIFAAPTIDQGRLYVGSADGRVYALEAATGRLLWRFRPGPSDRRVLVFGHLQSPWPVNSGVLVADGVAYAAAGIRLQPGSYVVALDAVTGKPRWQQMNPASANDVAADAPNGLLPDGYMVLAAGRLWVRSCNGNSGGFAFEPATGKPLPPKVSTSGLMGREIGVLRDRYLIYGGGDVYNSQDFRSYPRGGIGLLELAADGTPQQPDTCFVSPSCLVPAWNQDKIVTVTGDGQGKLQCWDATRVIAWACDPAKRVDLTKLKAIQLGFPKPHGLDDRGKGKEAESVRLWGPFQLAVNGLVLTPKTAIIAEGVKLAKGSDKPGGWQLSALSLDDGKPLWQTPLPSEPVTNVMSVDRDGRILIGLRNGNVVCYGAR